MTVVIGGLGDNVGVEVAGFGVMEVVSGITIVDEGLRDVSDSGLDRSDYDLLLVK